MKVTQRIAELEQTLVELDAEQLQLTARRRAAEAELDALRTGSVAMLDTDIAGMERTDAIVAVLRNSNRTMSIDEVMSELEAHGRVEDRKTVRSTFSYLLSQKRVARPDRGRYLAL